MSNYRFQKPPPRPEFGPLPEGDYSFVVTEANEPHTSSKGNEVLSLQLAIQPSGVPVFANPWAGKDKNGQDRDQIAEFLLCVNRAPKDGEEPNWKGLVGAKGKCRLTTEKAQQGAMAGKDVNKVHYFYTPKQADAGKPAASKQATQQSFTSSEFQKARQQQLTTAGAGEPEPDEIPY
jgi:hypothetical protein